MGRIASRRTVSVLIAAALAAWGFPAALTLAAAPDQPAGWKAVLIAGDDEEPAFDNAVDAMADKLVGFGVPRADLTILKASASGDGAATQANVEAAFAKLAPRPDEGCFVYITSHGVMHRGLMIRSARAFLTPTALARLLGEACGSRPNVVIASGCYSGIFASEPKLATADRTVLTAAREDRPSFGCNAHLQYTVFDSCVLASLERGVPWTTVMDHARGCVAEREWNMHIEAPSEPQLAIGANETGLRVFSP